MGELIYKFERDMLKGHPIYIHQKSDNVWSQKHWHNYYELVYFKRYKGVCTLNGAQYPISDGCVFLLTPKDFHQIVTEEVEDQFALIVAFGEILPDSILLDALNKGPFVAYEVEGAIEAKLDELFEVFGDDIRYKDLHIKHLFNCILIELLKSSYVITDTPGDVSPIVRESISLMLSDPTANLTLRSFAKRFNVTEAYFSRLFHKHAGISFKQYLTSLRLEYAKQLLEENELQIIEVGFECGFDTPSQFFRAFKRACGRAPLEYRKAKNKLI